MKCTFEGESKEYPFVSFSEVLKVVLAKLCWFNSISHPFLFPFAPLKVFFSCELKGPDVWPTGMDVDDLEMAIITGKDKWDEPILDRFPMNEEKAMNDLDSFMRK